MVTVQGRLQWRDLAIPPGSTFEIKDEETVIVSVRDRSGTEHGRFWIDRTKNEVIIDSVEPGMGFLNGLADIAYFPDDQADMDEKARHANWARRPTPFMESSAQEIYVLLTPEQRELFLTWLKKHKRHLSEAVLVNAMKRFVEEDLRITLNERNVSMVISSPPEGERTKVRGRTLKRATVSAT